MGDPFLSEIRIMAFDFPPKGWAFCNGQFLPINQNQALFSMLGVTYGGNGQTTFALPNLRGRTPIHFGGAHGLGEAAGSESVTVNIQQLPTHLHGLMATNANGAIANPTGAYLGAVNNMYTGPASLQPLSPASVTSVGGSQPHNNMMPYLVLNFCIALQGVFPSHS
jgi:microcystin-dependent protein